jgi:hypothetical protein
MAVIKPRTSATLVNIANVRALRRMVGRVDIPVLSSACRMGANVPNLSAV